MSRCLPPIKIDRVLERPALLREMTERNAPYYPVQRYLRSDAEQQSLSGGPGQMIIAPNFRGDWAYDRPLVDGAGMFLEHEGFLEAAKEIFDTDLIQPQQLYSNITWQLPYPQGNGHTDVPAFRGIDRTHYPVWFLSVMGRSRLFEEERIRIVTAVAWFYEGDDGGFEYWPDGPDAPPRQHQGDIFNTAIVGDNDNMFHRVMPVGDRDAGMPMGMDLETRLEREDADDQWRIADRQGAAIARPRWPELRISVSWKANAYRDRAEQRVVEEHGRDLSLEDALERLHEDLDTRGICCSRSAAPLEDPDFVEVLGRTYMAEPTVYG